MLLIKRTQKALDYNPREIKKAFQMLKNGQINEEYLPTGAKKVYEAAKAVTEKKYQDQILDHAEEYAFLKKHHIDKQIKTLGKWEGSESSKVIIEDGNIKLRSHPIEGPIAEHSVSSLIEEAEKDKNLSVELNYFSLITTKSDEKRTELTPAFQTTADGNYHVAIVTDCPKKMALTGNHAWLRLIDDKGRVISVGKFPEDLKIPFVFRMEAAHFSTTDKHEWLCRKDTLKEHKFTIKKEDFDALKQDIESDLSETKNHDFNVYHKNCSDWVIEKVGNIGLQIDQKKFQIDQFTLLYPNFSEWYEKKIPQKIRVYTDPLKSWASVLTLQVFRIALIIFFGGTKKNKRNKNSKRFFSIKEVFNRRLTHLSHPWKFRGYLDKEQENIQNAYQCLPTA